MNIGEPGKYRFLSDVYSFMSGTVTTLEAHTADGCLQEKDVMLQGGYGAQTAPNKPLPGKEPLVSMFALQSIVAYLCAVFAVWSTSNDTKHM